MPMFSGLLGLRKEVAGSGSTEPDSGGRFENTERTRQTGCESLDLGFRDFTSDAVLRIALQLSKKLIGLRVLRRDHSAQHTHALNVPLSGEDAKVDLTLDLFEPVVGYQHHRI